MVNNRGTGFKIAVGFVTLIDDDRSKRSFKRGIDISFPRKSERLDRLDRVWHAKRYDLPDAEPLAEAFKEAFGSFPATSLEDPANPTEGTTTFSKNLLLTLIELNFLFVAVAGVDCWADAELWLESAGDGLRVDGPVGG